MKNKGRLARRIIAVIVCMTLVLAALPTGVFSAFAQTEKGKLKVTSISDIHYFADSEKGTGNTKNGFSEAYNEWNDKGSRQHNEVDALLTAALDKAAEEKSDYVFLPGDLTLNGELAGHKALAAKLEAFEKEVPEREVVSRRISKTVSDGELVLKADYVFREDIAQQEEILLDAKTQ